MPLSLLGRRRSTFKLPRHMLGADLFWWRESPDLHTLVTIFPTGTTGQGLPPAELTLALFAADGTPTAQWTRSFEPDRPIVIDSARLRAERGPDEVPADGLLAAFVAARSKPTPETREKYLRLYSLVDWYSEDGELVSLHNDQSVIANERPIEFTEIVFRESADERSFIVLLNGDQPQPPGSLTLEAMNADGQVLSFVYPDEMTPFTVHRIELADCFEDLVGFCAGRHATLTGTFACRGLFTRPYVMSEGAHLTGYHGGDRYEWGPFSREAYEALSGRGQVNPMAALSTDEVRTTVNLFNTHGHLEEDAWVDAYLYDEAGALVAHRAKWLLAKRHELARGDVEDLLPTPDTPFVGHIALNFTPEDRVAYPGTVQALMEYRTACSTARTMAWADTWNSDERRADRGIDLAAYYRVMCDDRIVSYVSISNSGVPLDYDDTVEFTARLINVAGDELVHSGHGGSERDDLRADRRAVPRCPRVPRRRAGRGHRDREPRRPRADALQPAPRVGRLERRALHGRRTMERIGVAVPLRELISRA
ncbi:MAG: hypothetical protein ACYTGP_12100 [Planctomycetota bacterium]